MAEYIDKQATIDNIERSFDKETILNRFVRKIAISAVRRMEPADVRPVVRGKWVSDEDTYPGPGMRNYKCSACGKIAGTWRKGLKKEQLYPFCPMCGADMRGENNG
jgi:DNA-directed RNA polymerase subunit RPC12/RpoP